MNPLRLEWCTTCCLLTAWLLAKQADKTYKSPSRQSRFGLNAANFFQAEAVGVVLPVTEYFSQGSALAIRPDWCSHSAAGSGNFTLPDSGRDSGGSRSEPPLALLRRFDRCRDLFRCRSFRPSHGDLGRLLIVPLWRSAKPLHPCAWRTGSRPCRLPGPESYAGRKPGLEPRRQHRCRIAGLRRGQTLWQRLHFLLRSDRIAGGRLLGLLDTIAGTG